jgi:hypothetical protein
MNHKLWIRKASWTCRWEQARALLIVSSVFSLSLSSFLIQFVLLCSSCEAEGLVVALPDP